MRLLKIKCIPRYEFIESVCYAVKVIALGAAFLATIIIAL